MQRKYFYKNLDKTKFAYKANYFTFIVLCFLFGIDKRNKTYKQKSRLCEYLYTHKKFAYHITNLINDIFIWCMFIFKVDIECLNVISLETYILEYLNKEYYSKSPVYYNSDIESYDLKRKSLSLYLIRYYFYSKKFLLYSIKDEIQSTTFIVY